eukprot:5398431-Prymnesium_polylepis.1
MCIRDRGCEACIWQVCGAASVFEGPRKRTAQLELEHVARVLPRQLANASVQHALPARPRDLEVKVGNH